jgi:hypothetical protein
MGAAHTRDQHRPVRPGKAVPTAAAAVVQLRARGATIFVLFVLFATAAGACAGPAAAQTRQGASAGPHVDATVRYATPDPGVGANCSSPAEACSVTMAVNEASAGDTIIIGAGTYGSSSAPVTTSLNLTGTAGLTIEGAVPGPGRPVIYDSGDGAPSDEDQGAAIFVDGADATLQDVDIEATGGNAVEILNANATTTVVNRVIARTDDGNACDVESGSGATITDSLCVNTAPAGDDAGGIDAVGTSGTTTAINDTAISSGGGIVGLETHGSPAIQATNDRRGHPGRHPGQ